MKKILYKRNIVVTISALFLIMLLKITSSSAGLDWTYGSLSNADNLQRKTKAIAYAPSGTVYVSGTEENTSGHKLIVTKKLNSSGTLVASVTNSYFFTAGITLNDNATSVMLDANENVYVLGTQYGGSNRGYDIVLIKYNSSLTLQWKKLIYNANSSQQNYDDIPCKILIDASNGVYVTGTWSNVTITGFLEEPFVQKYNSSGTLIYSTSVPQSPGKTILDVSDMCIDNNLNVTVCARAEDNNDNYSIMYARISSAGSFSWKKFYSPNSVYKLLFNPEIECTSSGTLYLAAPINRRPNMYDNYVKLAIVKLNSSGTLLWEQLTTEFHEYADDIKLRLDAGNNIYAGSDFWGSPTPLYKNHRIYKFNSSGTQQWVYTSLETSKYFTFETFSSTALFILFEKSGPAAPVLRKLDTSNGNILWSETISFPPPAGYDTFRLPISAIAVNSVTSEVAYCGGIEVTYITPGNPEENRWLVKKYGATSPRYADHENVDPDSESKFILQLFPNPANDRISISWFDNEITCVDLTITDICGKIIYPEKKIVSNNNTLQVETGNFIPGVYTAILIGNQSQSAVRFIISR